MTESKTVKRQGDSKGGQRGSNSSAKRAVESALGMEQRQAHTVLTERLSETSQAQGKLYDKGEGKRKEKKSTGDDITCVWVMMQ